LADSRRKSRTVLRWTFCRRVSCCAKVFTTGDTISEREKQADFREEKKTKKQTTDGFSRHP